MVKYRYRETLPKEGKREVEFRHEQKIEINASDLIAVRSRLRQIMRPDPHAIDGKYSVRSLYFDNLADRALREKLDGVDRREKFRIRCYNGDTGFPILEKKSKLAGLCHKQSEPITPKQVAAILKGDPDPPPAGAVLQAELCRKMKTQGLRPKTVVEYLREPFVYEPGNVRITFDYNIRTGLQSTDFLNPACVTVPAGDAPILMEVKWDRFLPDVIRDAIRLTGRRAGAFSKYAQCRIYG